MKEPFVTPEQLEASTVMQQFLEGKSSKIGYEDITGIPQPEGSQGKIAVALGLISPAAMVHLLKQYAASAYFSVDLQHPQYAYCAAKDFALIQQPANAYTLMPKIGENTDFLFIDQAVFWDAPTEEVADMSRSERLFHLVQQLPVGAQVQLFIGNPESLTRFIEGLELREGNIFEVVQPLSFCREALEVQLHSDAVAQERLLHIVEIERSLMRGVLGYLRHIDASHFPKTDVHGRLLDLTMHSTSVSEQEIAKIPDTIHALVVQNATDEELQKHLSVHLKRCMQYLLKAEREKGIGVHPQHPFIKSAVEAAINVLE